MTDQQHTAEAQARLREIAEAATKGPWKVGNEDGDLDHYWRGGGSVVATADRKDLITFCHQWRENRENDATFIATFNPAQALSLLDLLAAQAARIEELEGALRPFLPITVNDTPDFAELSFGEHRTQAMTMAPVDWLALDAALTLARSALSEGDVPLEGVLGDRGVVGSSPEGDKLDGGSEP